MAEAKKSPVDRWNLLIGLEHCKKEHCEGCPYMDFCDCMPKASLANAAQAYIYYLEEQLEEALGV